MRDKTLTGAQSIFTLTMCCLQIDETALSAAAAMAVALRYHKPLFLEDSDNPIPRRAFWLVYIMEKHLAFQGHRNSVKSCALLPSPYLHRFLGWY